MVDDLDELRQKTKVELNTFIQKAERMHYLGIKLMDLRFLNGRTAFSLRKGFETSVHEAQIFIYGDGDLIDVRDAKTMNGVVAYNYNLKYKNLPLLDFVKVRIVIRTKAFGVDNSEAELHLIKNLDDEFQVVSPEIYNQYK